MSKYREVFILQTSLEDSLVACREAVAGLGWRVLEQNETRFICKEVAPQVTSFTWATQAEIVLAAESSDTTRVTINGSIFGLGPIQSGHLKGQIGNLRNRIQLALAKSQTSTSLVAELEKLAELHSRGMLSDKEYHQAKVQLLSKQSGNG